MSNGAATTSPSSQKAPALVIGSLNTAQDGSYMNTISALESSRKVERQMVDRIMDGAMNLPPSHFGLIHVSLASNDYSELLPRMKATLLPQLLEGLAPLGTLQVSAAQLDPTIADSIRSELIAAGFEILTKRDEDGMLIAQRPVYAPTTNGEKPAETAALPLRRRPVADAARRSSKKAIWALSSSNGGSPASSSGAATPIIDAESLLTPEDRAKPVPNCEPRDASSATRRRRACKNCTCGLAEEEEAEAVAASATRAVVLLDGDSAVQVTQSERERLLKAAENAPKATSSCGSCYMGDAFRCSGCPYIGLPAFKPGQKVEIDFGMDDI